MTEGEWRYHIADTLLHEMIHQYCDENGIVDVRANGIHTEAFAEAAEEHGLMVYSRQTNDGITYSVTMLDPDYQDVWDKLNIPADAG